MSIESAAIYEWEDRLSKAISRRGLSVSPQDFLAVLSDVADHSAPLTRGDKDFLTTYTGLSDEDLTQEAVDAADTEIAANRSAAAKDVKEKSYDTQEVAAVLKMAPANVRRAVREGALFSVKTSPAGHHLFPRWQFPYGRALPGLNAVISALPRSYHPLEIEEFMTEESEALRGMSPVTWLAEGGNVDEVVTLAEEMAWE